LPTYARVDLAFERGEGAWLFTAEGERYLDFTSGVAVNALGHAHPVLVDALSEQAKKVWHVSNLYRIPGAERLADRLCALSFADTVFFCNSGAEAVEGAIKMARKYQAVSGKPERFRVVTFEGAFHGRTLAALAAGGQKKYLEGFGPPVEGFDQVPYADLEATKKAIGPETGAILIEPIMGEGGVRVVPHTFLRSLRQLCDQHGLLLIFDEVQTGCGRTGDWFAYQGVDVTPDVMTLAKGICGGLAAGALLTTAEIAPSLRPGMHAATFGGNPIAARAGLAAIEMIEQQNLLPAARRLGEVFRQRLEQLRQECDLIGDVRVRGVMIGIELSIEGAATVKACMERRLLVNCTQGTVIRLLPAMNLSEEQAHQGCDILGEVLKQQAGADDKQQAGGNSPAQ
jgi:acetylornithine/N-succinyldiaminopimelate aminotransferase